MTKGRVAISTRVKYLKNALFIHVFKTLCQPDVFLPYSRFKAHARWNSPTYRQRAYLAQQQKIVINNLVFKFNKNTFTIQQ
jgi:hypothetical protein